MATLKLSVTTGVPKVTLARNFERSTSAKRACVQSIAQFIQSIVSGGQLTPTVAVSVSDNATPASGTVTAASVQAADTVTVNGVVFTAVNGSPTGNQFDMSGSNTACAASLAAAINASVTALVSGYVTASAASGVCTITSAFRGIEGNQTTLASSNGTRLAVSAARLTGGAADSAAKTYTF